MDLHQYLYNKNIKQLNYFSVFDNEFQKLFPRRSLTLITLYFVSVKNCAKIHR